MPPGARGRGRGAKSGGRGQLTGPQPDLWAETRKDIGLADTLYSFQQVEKPPPLYPHRHLPKRRAPLFPATEERLVNLAEELPAWSRASPYFFDNTTSPNRPAASKLGAASPQPDTSSSTLRKYLSDILRSDLYPKELVAPSRAPSAGKRARTGDDGRGPSTRRARQDSVGDDVNALAEREKAEGTTAIAGSSDASGGAPPRRRRGEEDEETRDLEDDFDEGEEEEEDFNDYAEVHDDDEGEDDGDDDYGGGIREAEY